LAAEALERIRRTAVDQEKVVAAIDRFRAVYARLQPYQRKELIRLVVARAEVSESSLRLQFHGNPASEEVFDKVRAPEGITLRRFEPVKWLPGLMSQSAVVRDYRALETGRRRANRLVLTVAG
jgi:hypothetical protein